MNKATKDSKILTSKSFYTVGNLSNVPENGFLFKVKK